MKISTQPQIKETINKTIGNDFNIKIAQDEQQQIKINNAVPQKNTKLYSSVARESMMTKHASSSSRETGKSLKMMKMEKVSSQWLKAKTQERKWRKP